MSNAYVELPVTTSAYWGNAVPDFASLPLVGSISGEVVLTLDTKNLYEWSGAAWTLILGSGADVVGPASATDNAVARFNGATGKLLQNSVVLIGDTGNVTGVVDLTATGTTTLAVALSGPVRATAGVISTGNTSLTSEVTGILPIANGGTNSSTALNNNRVISSSGGAIVELAAITASRALESNASGLPIASAVTSTELGYVSGVTSAIQTQLGTKVDKVVSTDEALVRFNGIAGAVQNSAVTLSDSDDMTIPGFIAMTGGAGTYLALPRLTTTERDALTPAGGFVIYNTTTDRIQCYIAGSTNAWTDLAGWGAPTG